MSRGRFVRGLTKYKTDAVPAKFEGKNSTILRPMSQKKRDKIDAKADLLKASRGGIATNWLLQEIYGEPSLFKPLVYVDPDCPRGFIKKFKKYWRNLPSGQ